MSSNDRKQDNGEKPFVIFGAGEIGRYALKKYGEHVAYFIDNKKEIQGTMIEGKKVKSVEEFIAEKDRYCVMIASDYEQSMKKQLEEMGVTDYVSYLVDKKAYYATEELIINPYELNRERDVTEEEWNAGAVKQYTIDAMNAEVERVHDKGLLFDHVEIETINRCNGNCDFCPVSKNRDPREYKEMEWQLFQSIIDQLSDMNYSGRLALFSNNEPFLDKTILEKHKYAREKLPNARMHLYTNATLLKLDTFIEVMKYLDELIIDNYQQELKLIKPCKEIAAYCEEHPELKKRVTIVLRKPHEILTSRGGDAPNRRQIRTYGDAKCVLPFKQLIIRPDGKVSLCCNDPLGKNTLGDLTKNTILEVWYNDKFDMVRKQLYLGRDNWVHCIYCDCFNLG